jgi:hypothetical protein
MQDREKPNLQLSLYAQTIEYLCLNEPMPEWSSYRLGITTHEREAHDI